MPKRARHSSGPDNRKRRRAALIKAKASPYAPSNRLAWPGPELKYIDKSPWATGNITTGGLVSVVACNLAQGTGVENRIGEKTIAKRLHLRGTIDWPLYDQTGTAPTVVDTANRVRLVVLVEKNYTGTAPLWSDVFDDSSAGRECDDFRLIANSRKYWVLKDKVYHPPEGRASVAYDVASGEDYLVTAASKTVRMNINLKDMVVQQSGISADLTAFTANPVICMVICDYDSTGNHLAPTITLASRYRFTDP